ncbi:MBOAT family protein [Leptospira langatensis]|uniref:MBOAT family protein n=1 Tax=Leptospira langatensis TaxID=2484983 RepID=A0A5F1ZS22_9LEPT|nr:MBOAT family O-acyltransferase [Leptospira langatensis]TGK01744.1 MBOAT family protein [Leptospira langatensis]TGL39351.1 MBOAT family protein [Leptospira langatensis]
MNFTTSLYFFFFLGIFLLRWILPVFRFFPVWIPKPFLLIGSYFFYLSWDPRFGLLLFGSSVLDYLVGLGMGKANPSGRKKLLLVSLLGNLSVLAFFKYFNFFIESGIALFSAFGLNLPVPVWRIALPVGISFYTFQSLSYTIDVYKREILPEKSFWNYALFLSFFPQLVAGPIVPARVFLPQLTALSSWKDVPLREGLLLIVLGVWKKAVFADSIAVIPDLFFKSPEIFSASYAWLAVLAYSLQIYFDFSGYTDIALGSALLLGFHLIENFRMPYLASSFSDFWRRWHISLSSWLRNYLYIPLGGNRKGEARTYIHLFLTMLLGGLWHGASWNFVIWGGLHGSFLALERMGSSFFFGRNAEKNVISPAILKYLYRGFVVFSVVLAWIFFRSPDWKTTGLVFGKLFSFSSGQEPNREILRMFGMVFLCFLIATWIGVKDEQDSRFRRWYEGVPSLLFGAGIAFAFLLAVSLAADSQPFLYFVF